MKNWLINNYKLISWILVIVWVLFIFIMSSFNSELSSSQSGVFVNFIAKIFNLKNIEVLDVVVRKMAHFTEYFILGILVCNLFKVYNNNIFIGIFLCILYALSDEVHQLFISGRHFAIFDVFIDSIGVIVGHISYKLGLIIFKKD